MHDADRALGLDLAGIAMGMDRLERQAGPDGKSGDGLVPIYLGDDIAPGRPYGQWAEARADLEALQARIAARGASDAHGVFLRQMAASLHAAVRLYSGEPLSFADKVRDLVGAEPGPVPEGTIQALTEALDAALTRAGFAEGALGERVERWEAARAVNPSALQAVFAELMAAAKARTAAMIFDTGDYDMRLNPVRDVFFTARCGFSERRMDLNVENRFTRAALKHLVCHEVFPGHATQLLSTRKAVEEGRAGADALLCTADAVTGCVQEGIGDQGVQLIDWVEDEDDVAHMLLRRLKSAVQTTAAWRLMVEGAPREEVADQLRTCAFGQEPWVQGRLRMAEHPFRGPFIASYYHGDESVRRVRERVAETDRPAFIAYLYDQCHSPESLAMFTPQAVSA